SFLYTRDNVEVEFEDTAIIRDNEVDKYGVIDIASASMYINGDIIIKDNKNSSGKEKNVIIGKGASLKAGYIYSISTASEIYFTDISTDSKIFRYWNEHDIMGFDSFDSGRVAYLPDEIFKVDEDSYDAGYRVYKKGTYSNVALMLGKEYEQLVFTSDKDHKNIIATQYVARGIDTYVDTVRLKDINIEDANWVAPDLKDETKETDWIFGNGNRYSVNITSKRYATLVSHTHRICGLLATESCAHIDGESHKVVTFKYVSNLDELITALAKTEPAYVALRNDIVVYDNLKTPITNVASGSTICLSGHNLIFEHGNTGFRLLRDGVLNITDCGNKMKTGTAHRGYITENNSIVSLNESAFNLQRDATVNFYNVQIASFSFSNSDYGMSIVNVGRDAKANLHDVTFTGNRINNADINLISNASLNGEIIYDKVLFKDNVTGVNDSLLVVKDRVGAAGTGVTFGEMTFENNTSGKAITVNTLTNVVFGKLTFRNNELESLVRAEDNASTNFNVFIATNNIVEEVVDIGESAVVSFDGETTIASNSLVYAAIYLDSNAGLIISSRSCISDNKEVPGEDYTPIYLSDGSTLDVRATFSIINNKGAYGGGAIIAY
ncbi:MAG: hypothetical protein IJ593_04255, partial [Lachnospiraceae bacterium]|nr:hypothetical protein [Lachnospiraceae bacterium]